MRTLFVFNHPAPYKVSVFNELAKLTKIRVIFERIKAKDRPDSFYANNEYNFPHIFFKKGYFGRENTFSGELKKYIKKHHQDYDAIVMNGYSTIAEMKAIRYMVKHHIPYILQINGGVIKKDGAFKRKLKTFYISNASKYFSPCSAADEYLVHYGAEKDNIYHYPYANYFEDEILKISLSEAQKDKIRKKWNLPQGTIFVNASQFIERKNNIQLMKLFKNRSETLLLIGSGKLKQEYENTIKSEKLNNVILMDYKTKADLFEILRACDYFITLSREDIFGHTTLEAMANGLPTISSVFVVSSRDYIVNGKNGYIVDIKDDQSIINAIDKASKLSSKEAIKTAHKNSIEQSANTLYNLLKE